MIPKLILSFVFILSTNFVLNVSADNFFKVPLEVREKNRPERLVESSTDPDLRTLREIQDKFFNIVGNTSLGKEFTSFKQLLTLVDSNAGLELGKLLFRGVMIGYGKENSNQLLSEFLDDFQYRLSPDLADALVDYKDFLKTVDLKMIPLTIQTLFRKDELGNSLAQIPLGQLVDLVQPEASKYGIDIKAVINGILGKGDSTFPDIIKKVLDFFKNFDVASLINGISKFDNKDLKNSKDPNDIKRQNKDPTLMLFKPFISNILKENKIDLDTDAVIQVLTPFVTPILQSLMPSSQGKDGKQNGKMDLSHLLPILSLLGSQFGGSKDSNNQGANILNTVMSMMGGLGGTGKDDPMANLLNVASGLLQQPKKNKKLSDDYSSVEVNEVEPVTKKKSSTDKKDDRMEKLLNKATNILQKSNQTKDSKEDSAQSAQAMESVMSVISMLGNLDKKDDSINNLLKLASGMMGNKKSKDGTAQTPYVSELVMSMMSMMGSFGGQDKKGNSIVNMLNMASSVLDMANKNKKTSNDGLIKDPNALNVEKKYDSMDDIVNMAASLLGNKNPSKDGSAPKPDAMESIMSIMSLMGNINKDGKKDDPLANIVNLASSVLGNKKSSGDGSGQQADILESAMSMISMLGNKNKNGKNDDSMGNVLNVLSGVLGTLGKDGKNDGANVLGSLMSALGGAGGEDIMSLVNIATSMLGKGKTGEKASLKESYKSHPRYKKAQENVAKVIELASKEEDNVITDKTTKTAEIKNNEIKQTKIKIDTSKTKSFTSALDSLIVEFQSNKIVLYKLGDVFSLYKALFKMKFRTLKDFEKVVDGFLKQYNAHLNAHDLIEPFLLPQDQFDVFISETTKEDIKSSTIITMTIAEIVKTLTDKRLPNKLKKIWAPIAKDNLGPVGLKDVDLENFPQKLGPIIKALSMQYNVPSGFETLLVPLQNSIKDSLDWYEENINGFNDVPKDQLDEFYADSFYDNIVDPLKSIWRLRKVSKTSPACLPRAVCDTCAQIPEDQLVRLLVTRIASIVYGGYIADEEQNYELLLKTIRASITSEDCKKTFPVECPKPAVPKGDIEDAEESYKHAEL